MLGEKLGEFQDKVTGRRILSAAASMLCLALVLFPIANVRAAELQILAGGAMTGPLRELATQFESASGHKLVFRFGTTPELIKLATTGGPFDLGIVPVDVMKDAAAQVRFASGPTTNIARVGLGVAVRSGAHKAHYQRACAYDTGLWTSLFPGLPVTYWLHMFYVCYSRLAVDCRLPPQPSLRTPKKRKPPKRSSPT